MFKVLLAMPLVLSATELDVVRVSEAMGHMIGKNLDSLGLDFDMEAIVRGIKEEANGISSPMNEDECVQAINILQEEKLTTTIEKQLEKIDAISNGDQILDHENYSSPTPDSSKHR